MTSTNIRLGVVGTGYVGLTTGGCFAHLGHQVVCGDIDPRKVDMLNAGHIPIVEDGLEQIVNEARTLGRIEFVLGVAGGRRPMPTSSSCVCRRRRVKTAVPICRTSNRRRARSLRYSSRERWSSTSRRCRSARRSRSRRCCSVTMCSVVSNPEFLREGTAVNDFLVARSCRHRCGEPCSGREGRRAVREHRHAGDHHRPGVGRDDQVRRERVPRDEDQLRQRRGGDV